MIFRTAVPSPPLEHFVALLWLYEGYAPAHGWERVLPTGTVELVINLDDDMLRVCDRQAHDRPQSFRDAIVCGPHAEFFVRNTTQQARLVGVHFKPGGAFPFLGWPANELHDLHVGLDTLWGAAAAELRDRLLAAPTSAAIFGVLEQALLSQATRPLTRHPAVAFALREFQAGPHPRTIADVSAQIGISPRRFIELFNAEVGLTPKLFCRVQRFQQVLRLIDSGRPIAWTEIALACGYFDQAHFIHDFQAFAGLTPTAYLSQRSEHFNHVPLAD